MNILAGERQTGRTTKLIHKFIDDPDGYLVVSTEAEKTRIWRKYHIEKNRIFTYANINSRLSMHGYHPKPNLYIDDLEMFMRHILSNQANVPLCTLLSTKVTKVDEEITMKNEKVDYLI